MLAYLLDTCAWIDALLAPEKLTHEVRELLAGGGKLYLSQISLIEFARKEARGDISLRMPCQDWFEQIALPKGRIHLLDISTEIAIDATRLPEPFEQPNGKPHKDPADQIIVATARCHRLTLLTSDQVLLDYSHVQCLSSRD